MLPISIFAHSFRPAHFLVGSSGDIMVLVRSDFCHTHSPASFLCRTSSLCSSLSPVFLLQCSFKTQLCMNPFIVFNLDLFTLMLSINRTSTLAETLLGSTQKENMSSRWAAMFSTTSTLWTLTLTCFMFGCRLQRHLVADWWTSGVEASCYLLSS